MGTKNQGYPPSFLASPFVSLFVTNFPSCRRLWLAPTEERRVPVSSC